MFDEIMSALFLPESAPETLEDLELEEPAEDLPEEREAYTQDELEEPEEPETAWREASEAVQEDRAKHGLQASLLNTMRVRHLSGENTTGAHNMYGTCTDGCASGVHVQDIYTRTAKNSYYNRYARVKGLIGFGALAIAAWFTVTGSDIDTLIVVYLIAAAVVFSADPGFMFDRLLAPQARYTLATVCVLLAMVPYQTAQYGKFALIVSVLLCILVKLLNKQWLSAYNWCMSDACRNALTRDYGSPHDDRSAAAYWQAYGARELKTLLFSLGILPTDAEIEAIYKPIFCVGYMAEHRTMRRVNEQIDDAEILKRNYRQMQTELEGSKADNEHNLAYIEELETENENIIKQMASINASLEKARAEIKRLHEANTELSGYAVTDPEEHREQKTEEPEPEHTALTTVSMKQKRSEHQKAEIIRLYGTEDGNGNKYSMRDIARQVGCSPSHVADVIKQYNREKKAEENALCGFGD